MKFKALRMALAAGFLTTTTVIVAVSMIEHSLVTGTTLSMVATAPSFSIVD